jgi:hypothetical protein
MLKGDMSEDARQLLIDVLTEPEEALELEEIRKKISSSAEEEKAANPPPAAIAPPSPTDGFSSSESTLTLLQRFSRLDVLLTILIVLQMLTLAVLIIAVAVLFVVTLISLDVTTLDVSSFLPEVSIQRLSNVGDGKSLR